jgi:hypothetical protein
MYDVLRCIEKYIVFSNLQLRPYLIHVRMKECIRYVLKLNYWFIVSFGMYYICIKSVLNGC